MITKGNKFVIINNTKVKPTSKIFITPTTKTGGQSLIVEEKLNGSFKVSIENTNDSDITFDYWVVDVN